MNLLANKKGLSVVVTTLIILVVSVLLATIVTLYAINVTTTRMESEDLKVTKHHLWANSTMAQAAFVLTNVGGRDVLLDKITIRDQEEPWSDVYYWKGTAPTHDLDFSDIDLTGASVSIDIEGSTETFAQATDDIAVESGTTLVIYINSPDSIGVSDIEIGRAHV